MPVKLYTVRAQITVELPVNGDNVVRGQYHKTFKCLTVYSMYLCNGKAFVLKLMSISLHQLRKLKVPQRPPM